MITNCTCDDSALYSCRAVNSEGLAETNAYLKVKETVKEQEGEPPSIITPLESYQINSNINYVLECVVSGIPEPTITWLKDDIEIEDASLKSESSFKISKFVNIMQLTINNTSDKHSGKYTCKAQNEHGIAETSAVIVVKSSIKRAVSSNEHQRAPIITESLPASYIVKEGQLISLSCQYDAYPRVEAIWLRDDKPIDFKMMGLSKDFKVNDTEDYFTITSILNFMNFRLLLKWILQNLK